MSKCTKSYGNKQILTDVTLSLSAGMYFLKGDNGSGKSVLLRGIASLENFTSGNYKNYSKNILYLTDQSLTHNYLTIGENISLLYSLHNLTLLEEEKNAINELYTIEQLNTVSEQASLGMKLKVGCSLLAKVDHWDLVILDETFSNIDVDSRNILLKQCSSLVQKGTCVLVVSHHNIEEEYQDKKNILKMSKGRIIKDD